MFLLEKITEPEESAHFSTASVAAEWLIKYPTNGGRRYLTVFMFAYILILYSKTCVKRPLSKRPKLVFKTNYRLMQVKSIAECSKHSAILSTFTKLPIVVKCFC